MKKNIENKFREDFRCSSILYECLRMDEIIRKKSRYDLIEEIVWKYLNLEEIEKERKIDTVKSGKGITFTCSVKLKMVMDQEGKRINEKYRKYLSNDEIIKRAIYLYFDAKNEEELNERYRELRRKMMKMIKNHK